MYLYSRMKLKNGVLLICVEFGRFPRPKKWMKLNHWVKTYTQISLLSSLQNGWAVLCLEPYHRCVCQGRVTLAYRSLAYCTSLEDKISETTYTMNNAPWQHFHTSTYTLLLPHTDDKMNVTADPLGVCRKEIGLGGLQPSILHYRLHVVVNEIQVFKSINVRDIPRVQYIVDVFQKWFTFDLWGLIGQNNNTMGPLEQGNSLFQPSNQTKLCVHVHW